MNRSISDGPASEQQDRDKYLAGRWDIFLRSTPRGQFQQSSGWAKVKAIEGWQSHRVYLDSSKVEAGGFQLLWKQTRFGRIGYVSKGPVLSNEEDMVIARALDALTKSARDLGLGAVVVQPPDGSRITAQHLARWKWDAVPLSRVISATALIDLTPGWEAVDQNMNRRVRQEARQAQKRGVTVEWGTRSDLADFFQLMEGSCRRQRTSPNPARVEILEAMWDEFAAEVHLGFACLNGKRVASLFLLGFASTMSFLKKGWNSEIPSSHANSLLNYAAIQKACELGWKAVDFGAIDRGIAESLLKDRELTPEQLRSRHVFNLRLGAKPVLLPTAHLLLLNPVGRTMLRLLGVCPALRDVLLSRAGLG